MFEFHSTVVINFFGGGVIFCAYPKLTLQYLARVNPAVTYSRNMGMDTMDVMWKYILRGFHYVDWLGNARKALDAPY